MYFSFIPPGDISSFVTNQSAFPKAFGEAGNYSGYKSYNIYYSCYFTRLDEKHFKGYFQRSKGLSEVSGHTKDFCAMFQQQNKLQQCTQNLFHHEFGQALKRMEPGREGRDTNNPTLYDVEILGNREST